jgi:hypothetical protein
LGHLDLEHQEWVLLEVSVLEPHTNPGMMGQMVVSGLFPLMVGLSAQQTYPRYFLEGAAEPQVMEAKEVTKLEESTSAVAVEAVEASLVEPEGLLFRYQHRNQHH